MNIIIRNVQPKDLDAVTAIEAECFPPAEAAERESGSSTMDFRNPPMAVPSGLI